MLVSEYDILAVLLIRAVVAVTLKEMPQWHLHVNLWHVAVVATNASVINAAQNLLSL